MTSEHCRLWANNTGVGRAMDSDRIVRFGLKGSPDIIGLYKGLFLGIEVKTGNAKQSKEQKFFQNMVDNLGGIYVVCRETDINQINNIVEHLYLERSKE